MLWPLNSSKPYLSGTVTASLLLWKLLVSPLISAKILYSSNFSCSFHPEVDTVFWVLFSNTRPVSEGEGPVPMLLFLKLEPNRVSALLQKNKSALRIQKLVSSISNPRHFKALKVLPQSKHNKNTLNFLNNVVSHMKFWQSYSSVSLEKEFQSHW